jgi:hypothetical protein
MPKQEKKILQNIKSESRQNNLLKSYKAITLNPEVLPTFT